MHIHSYVYTYIQERTLAKTNNDTEECDQFNPLYLNSKKLMRLFSFIFVLCSQTETIVLPSIFFDTM